MDITVQDVKYTREEWVELTKLNGGLAEAALSADILVVPSSYVDRPLAFPVSTMEFYTLLKQKLGEKVEICVNDDDYEEVELNSRVLRLAKLRVRDTVLPFIISYVAAYVYDRTAAPAPEPVEVNVTVNVDATVPEYAKPTEMDFTIEVEDSVTGKSKAFHYKGSASDFKEASNEIMRMWDEEKSK